jgi:SprT protein
VQLDFFTQLAGAARAACTPKPRPLPAPTPAAPTKRLAKGRDRILEEQVRTLLKPLGFEAFGQGIQVVWNARMRSTAGMAYPRRDLITLNPRLRDFGEGEVDRTLRHELAHLLAHHRVGRRRIAPHGPEWAKACHDLGLTDEKRCHDLPLPRREMKARHFYRCPGCATELQRVRPLRRKSACLACCRRHSGGYYDERFRFVKAAAPLG